MKVKASEPIQTEGMVSVGRMHPDPGYLRICPTGRPAVLLVEYAAKVLALRNPRHVRRDGIQ